LQIKTIDLHTGGESLGLITGQSTFYFDPEDTLKNGFILDNFKTV